MLALAIGLGTTHTKGAFLEVYFPHPLTGPAQSVIDALDSVLPGLSKEGFLRVDSIALHALAEALKTTSATAAEADQHQHAFLAGSALELSHLTPGHRREWVICLLDTEVEPASVPDGYLRLQLLSHRLIKPHAINLTGLFGVLPNLAWTSEGAVALDELPARQLQSRASGRPLRVYSVDKFPAMTDYVVPSGVRIADTARVRLGAYIGEGTTIMHEGFVNFNAGTEGKSMIEGRISAGVMVGEGSDLGGGCSTMGTLSGGGNIVISVGRNSLIGANAGIGIPLGDNCRVEAGLYITAGTKLTLLDAEQKPVRDLKARELAGQNDLLFRRNSSSGRVEALANRSAVELNEALHAHN